VREVLERHLEAPRLAAALARLRGSRAILQQPARPTPFAFPLMVEMFREKLTTEALEARVAALSAEAQDAGQTQEAREAFLSDALGSAAERIEVLARLLAGMG